MLIFNYILFNLLINMSLPIDLYKKKRSSSYMFSLLFLIAVLILTWGLYVYNKNVVWDISDINVKINELDNIIENIKKDEKLQIYSLIETNKKSLDILEYNSQIPDYIEHYREIGEKYKIDLENFSYTSWKINTPVNFNQENEVTYLRVVNFLKNYRKSPDSLFDLDFVKSVSGHDVMSFNIWLSLKDLSEKKLLEQEINKTENKEEPVKIKQNIEKEDDIKQEEGKQEVKTEKQ